MAQERTIQEPAGRRVDVDRETLVRILRETPVDDELARDVESLEAPIERDSSPAPPSTRR